MHALIKLPVKQILFILFPLFVLSACSRPESGARTVDLPDEDLSSQYAMRIELDLPIPEFQRPTLAGDVLTSSSLSGKVTIVNFWATWCGPCIIEIPDLVALYDEWSDRDIEIVGVSMDPEGFEIVEPFATDFQISYPIIMDDGELAEAFGGVYALPTTFLVDANGTVVYRFLGLIPFDEMKDRIVQLMRKTDSI